MNRRGAMSALVASAIVILPTPAVAKSDPPIRFATYNVCKTSCGVGQFSWEKRQSAVIRNILSARPDVIALQEVDNSWYWIQEQLKSSGYAMAESFDDDCTDAETGCVDDSRLFYRTARVQQLSAEVPNEPIAEPCQPYLSPTGELDFDPPLPVYPPRPVYEDFPDSESYTRAMAQWRADVDAAEEAYNAVYAEGLRVMQENDCSRFQGWTPTRATGSGLQSLAALSGSAGPVEDRNFAWAVFKDRRTGGAFVAASIHMPNEKTPAAEKYRERLARKVSGFVKSRARQVGKNTPVMLMGDLNSYWQRQPRGVQWLFGRAGFTDAFEARQKVNDEVPTVNVTKTQPNPFPARPFRFDQPARIDYVMCNRGRALRYEVHLRLKPSGAFDNRYRGSDHNLVLADLVLPKQRAGKDWAAR